MFSAFLVVILATKSIKTENKKKLMSDKIFELLLKGSGSIGECIFQIKSPLSLIYTVNSK